jgi:hypothetical protein
MCKRESLSFGSVFIRPDYSLPTPYIAIYKTAWLGLKRQINKQPGKQYLLAKWPAIS